MNEEDLEDYKPVAAVANAVAILRALAQHIQPVGLATIVRETGISASTCLNILRTLTHDRIIFFDHKLKVYRIGLGALEFSMPLLGMSQADIIRPEMESLTNKHHVLICLWQLANDRIVLLDSVASTDVVRVEMPRGARLPAYAGAVGRCYAAHSNADEVTLRNGFDKVSWQSPPTFEEFKRDVQDAAKHGYAFDLHQLYRGLETAASIITDSSGRARFGISAIDIFAARSRQQWRDLAADLRDAADWISEMLFGVPRSSARAKRKLSKPAVLEARSRS